MLEARLLDFRGNEIASPIDIITGNTVVDARTIAATLSANGAESVMQLNGQSTVVFDIRTAAGSMTFNFEATIDGTNYFLVAAYSMTTQAMVSSVTITTTHAVTYMIACGGFRAVRVKVTAFTSGTIVVAGRGSVADIVPVAQPPFPTTLWVTATAAANAQATATLPAVVGCFHYITYVSMMRNATAALAGTATLIHTTTNLPGSPAWSVGNAMVAGGTQIDVEAELRAPLRSSVVNTATTFVMPAAGAAVLNRINIGYYIGL